MNPTPFEADCNRKASGLRDFNDHKLRRNVCANCLVLRKFHREVRCRYRRMTDAEWADYCGIPQEPKGDKDNYLREVVETKEGGLKGLYYFRLECGHRESRLLSGVTPKIPTTFKCAACAKEGEQMNWINGKSKDRADVTVLAATPAAEPKVALVVSDKGNGITAEIARFMPVMDMQQAVARRNIIVNAMQDLMQEGVDYGKLPGSEKPALLKPGAQKLCNLFGLTLKYQFLEKVEDWTGKDHGGEPFFYYQLAAEVYRGDFMLAEGLGSCNSWEAKYRWRNVDRTCPACGQANIRKSKNNPEWYCWARLGGCGQTYAIDDPVIIGQPLGRKPNPDVADQINTILKMAEKRCMVDGVLNATSASEFFTQDVEDFTPPMDDIDTGGHRTGTSQAAQYVAEQKITTGRPTSQNIPWRNMGQMADMFKAMRQAVGETAYLGELDRYGWHQFRDIKNAIDNRTPQARDKAAECYWHLDAIARKEGK